MAWMLAKLEAKGARFGIGSVPKLSMGRARVPVPHVKHKSLKAKMTAAIFLYKNFRGQGFKSEKIGTSDVLCSRRRLKLPVGYVVDRLPRRNLPCF
jgi:hypothetical protein